MFKLRPYQQECLDNLTNDLKELNKLGVVLPTGSGKTCIFIELLAKWAEKYESNILILSHMSLLTKQTFDRFRQTYPTIPIGILQGKRQPTIGDRVVIATVQSARDEGKTVKWIKNSNRRVGLVIGDEIHRLMGTKTFEEALKQHESKIVGFTATPFRDAQFITNAFDKISYTLSMQELIDMKYLVPFDLKQVVMGLEVEPADRIAQTLHLYQNNEKGNPAVMYWRTVEEANLARNAFSTEGINCSVITGDIKDSVRDKIMGEFRDGKVQVLSTCDVLTAGVDMPKLEAIFMPYGTKSPTVFLQRCGRGSRPEDCESLKSEHKKQTCRIYMAGNAPTIKSGFYKKLLNYTLNEGSQKYVKDIFDDKEFMELTREDWDEDTTERYKWTKEACDVVQKFEEMKLMDLGKMLRAKKFPPRYLKHLDMMMSATKNIKEDTLLGLDKALRESTDKWILPTGKMMGIHVSKVPFYYRNYVMNNLPDSPVGKMLIKWYWKKERN